MMAFIIALLISVPAFGSIDDLNSDLPLQIEDARLSGAGSLSLQATGRIEGENEYKFVPNLQYGAAPRTQVEISLQEGDIESRALFSLIKDRVAFGIQAELPTGAGSSGVDPGLKLVLTQPLAGDRHRIHANARWDRNFSPSEDERVSRYQASLGYTYQMSDRWMLIADVARVQEEREANTSDLAEIGVVSEIGKDLLVSGGMSFGVGQQAPDFQANLGVQLSLS